MFPKEALSILYSTITACIHLSLLPCLRYCSQTRSRKVLYCWRGLRIKEASNCHHLSLPLYEIICSLMPIVPIVSDARYKLTSNIPVHLDYHMHHSVIQLHVDALNGQYHTYNHLWGTNDEKTIHVKKNKKNKLGMLLPGLLPPNLKDGMMKRTISKLTPARWNLARYPNRWWWNIDRLPYGHRDKRSQAQARYAMWLSEWFKQKCRGLTSSLDLIDTSAM